MRQTSDMEKLNSIVLVLCLVWLLCVLLIPICCRKSEAVVENPIDPSCSVGEYVTFGSYRHKEISRKKQPIEWLVLAREDEKALLISRYALICSPFEDRYKSKKANESTTWNRCSLRFWLNYTFLNTAFDEQEQMAILDTTTYKAVEDPWRTGAGMVFSNLEEVEAYYFDKDAKDKVFLLSVEEAEQYFKTDEERICKPTEYAICTGCSVSEASASAGNCWWWVRSSGTRGGTPIVVSCNGSLYARGVPARNHFVWKKKEFCIGVRPAIWVDLGAISSESSGSTGL